MNLHGKHIVLKGCGSIGVWEAGSMSAQGQLQIPGARLASRLESIIDSLPKEGFKAAVALGVVDRVSTLLGEVREVASKVACLSQHKGVCRGSYCEAGCGGLFLEAVGEEMVLARPGPSPFAARLSSSKMEVEVKGARLILDGSTLHAGVRSGDGYTWVTVDLTDADSVYQESYTVKYVLKRVGAPLIKARTALKGCMALAAITC